MSVAGVHAALAWVVVVANGIAGAWALAGHWVAALRHRVLWWTVAGAQASIFAEVALGVARVAGRDEPAPQFHMFYGFVAAFTVAIIYAYRAQLARRRYLLYGLGGLFLMGLSIRAMVIPVR